MAELNDSADLFANSSTETVKENLDYINFLEEVRKPTGIVSNRFGDYPGHVFTSSPMSPGNKNVHDANFSFLANQFISEACNIPVTLYCPFCSFTCHFEFIFKDHIKNTHPSEIMNIAKSNSFYIEFHACPFCHAKFFMKDLLPRHVLMKHEDSVIFKGLGHSDYAQCRFCSYKLLQRHVKRLVMHIEKKHMTDLDNFLKHQNTSVTLSTKEMKFFCDDIEELSLESCENINKDNIRQSVGKMRCIKSILKPPSTPQNHNLERCAMTPNNGSYEAIRQQNSARRKLRFDLPESLNENKENRGLSKLPTSDKKGKLRWFSMFKKNKRQGSQLSSPIFKPTTTPPKTPCDKSTSFFTKFHLENDGVSPLTTHHFKCGLCYQEFQNNAELLSHLRSEHRGLNFTAQYRCGACNAKFYRNSYLVRHCWFHHTPLCLKKEIQMDQVL